MLSIFNRLAFFAASAESVTEPVTEALPNNPIVVEPLPFLPRAFAEFITDGLFGEITKDIALKDYSTWHYVVMVLMYLSIIIIPYLLGSLNFAVVVSKRMYGEDIREFGSGNAGLTNMYRIYGKKGAGFTLLGDSLKTVFSVALGYFLLGNIGSYVAALFCIFGHIFPIFYRFHGGKGVLTTAVAILMTDPPIFLVLFVVFAVIVGFTKYVSLGSIMCMMMYPLLVSRLRNPGLHVIISFTIAAVVVFMHRSNIKRLWNGKESKFSFKEKLKESDEANGPDRDKE